MAEYKSKTVVVNKPSMVLFNALTDLENLRMSLPEDKRSEIEINGSVIKFSYANFTIAIELKERSPFSKVVYADVEAPFHFSVTFNLSERELVSETSLSIEISAELNFMMKTLLGSKIQEYLDKAVDAIANGEYIR